MKSFIRSAISICLVFCFSISFAKAPVGVWTTIDDKTGEKRADIDLYLSKSGTLKGKILMVRHQPGDTGICKKCPGRFKDKPIQGLTILWGLKEQSSGVWSGGKILDPKSGKIYKVNLEEKDNKIYVRAYIGLPLLGRTQVWVPPTNE